MKANDTFEFGIIGTDIAGGASWVPGRGWMLSMRRACPECGHQTGGLFTAVMADAEADRFFAFINGKPAPEQEN